ncbi:MULTISPECIES: carbohydrate ABC transporter permease [Micromonospora]|uniref:carbohydrate ABC transporter permease n=1 Tax=Micromonospora TaxID=1873 RepID=UPI0003EEA431|nr:MULTISPECIES: carbohydrate ABC transporter permease [unclassified Micromonospora]EWM62941.1 ABC transporter permease [Micromonospora sp. M42]MBP1784222.1 putative aldouronate transport system permease protein [Micromonospora sp. HB375]MCK1804370.1 carbohydrate ABC transporter permease [Micromonospora sp. R42106]MCK1832153.1 carbohydrate ABC transporter permease [Micromonospora sp. R42003]MCK1843345.1 carbohydrate ABC transporter permease [Micromonospora sp. R42004]
MSTQARAQARTRKPAARPRGPRPTRGYRVFQVVNALVLTGVVVVTLYPFLTIVSRSLSDNAYIVAGEVNLVPRGFNLTAYRVVTSDPTFWVSYRNTVFYTVVATLVSVVLTTCYAYVLSKKHLRGRTALVGIAVFTMFFTGGLIPNYVLVTSLGLKNTVWAIALPNAINVFNLLVMKAFFESLPVELEEAAAVDGLNTYGTLLRIVLPLSKAMVATMVLFYAVSFWNSWFAAFLYMDRQDLLPVTVYLRNLIAGATDATQTGGGLGSAGDVVQSAATIQSVTIVLTILPILAVYPFIQRYFVSGIMLGAVKG